MRLEHLVVAVSVVGLLACGGGGDGGTGPVTQPKVLDSVRITPGTLTLNAGQTGTVSAEALDASGSVISNVTGFTYTSSAPAVAELRGEGTVLAVGAGSATITVSLTRDGKTATASASVTVTGSLPSGATVTAGTNNTFTPQTVVIARNGSVDFEFASVVHNVTYGSATGAPANIPNSSNTSVSRTFSTAGDFAYQCTIHSGMTGLVVVR
jgi:plastocyanin